MEKNGIKKETRERIMDIYSETKMRIRTKEGYSREFWTKKGVRQRCILSLILFNLYIADMDNYFRSREIGDVRLGKEKI